MSILFEVRKFKSHEIVLFFLFLLSSIAPGFLTLFLFKPYLIQNLDIFKIIIFSIALTLPITAINFLVTSLALEIEEEEPILVFAFAGTFVSFIVFYASLIVCYLGAFSFFFFLMIIVGLEVMTFIVCISSYYVNKKNPNK